MGVRNHAAARMWLQQFKHDPLAMHQLRILLSESHLPWSLHRAQPYQVIDWVASLLGHGKWHVHAPVLVDGGQTGDESSGDEADIADIETAAPVLNDRKDAPQRPQEEGSLPRSVDEATLVAGMKLASELGIPFCEECAKAAAKRALEAAFA
jgi:hypothetical protein